MISTASQFNLFEGERRRDEGISLTEGNNLDWMANAVACVRRYAPHDEEFMADTFRTYPGIGTPKSNATWGALTRRCIELRIIVATGRYDKSSATKNHAHKYAIYRRVTR